MSLFTYGFRVKKILKNENETAFFTPKEIVSAIVNLLDAKRNLTYDEYFFVSVVFKAYRCFDEKILLCKRGFLGLCNDIIAHFDLIAPYYRFCGDSRMQILMLVEDEKYEYRQRAKAILEKKAIFKEEWMELHREFKERFHSHS